ncbi:MAG: two-component system sensor histidine kinase PhoR [Wenzhouxiangella sp.]|nr:MAG: two-component system sensor histidine kinase PhoR [Wenzhouxiangella sp.]
MRQAWLSELLLLSGLVFAALLLAALFGYFGWFMFAALVGFTFRHLYQLYRLERWLRVGRVRNPPESWGIWGDVFEHYYRLQRRYYKRKKRLARVIREFRESTAAMPDGTLVLNSEFRIMWFNEAARQNLRLSSNRDLGQPIGGLLRSPRFKSYLDAGEFDQPVNVSSPIDDTRTLAVRLIPYGADQYLLLVRDVTRIQRLQTMRRDFVANASHELRSPLTVLSGYLEALADEKVLGEEWRDPLEDMQAQCQRMNTLVNDLLELSRLETEEGDATLEVAVDVPTLAERIVRSARAEDRDRHRIELEVISNAGLAGAESELYSAFSNLVVNAIRYTTTGGVIRARWFARPGGELVFEVADTGIGIDEKHLPFITQRFYRIDSSHSRLKGGTGLGLAIVKHVLQRHNGRLEVESTPGEGSVFRCVFPQQRARYSDAISSGSSILAP